MPKSANSNSDEPLPSAIRKLKLAEGSPRGARPLTARAVSELCGVELKTIHNWVAEGRIAHFRTPGRHLRFQVSEVLRFLEACGHREATQSRNTVLLAVASPVAARALRRQLGEHLTEHVNSAFEALIVAGRITPSVIIVHAPLLNGHYAEAWCQAITSVLPQTRVLLVDSKRPLAGAERVSASDVRAAL